MRVPRTGRPPAAGRSSASLLAIPILLLIVLPLATVDFSVPSCRADELDEFDADEPSSEEPEAQPIAVELAQGIELLTDQITKQQELLKTAKSEREQELIRSHIRLLQKERRSLESLLHRLVGPNFEIRESVKEQQTESRTERQEKTLERDERFEAP